MTLENLPEHYQKQLTKFNSFSVSKLVRKDIGSVGFQQLEGKITTVKRMLDEIIVIVETVTEIPHIYIDALFNHIALYNSVGNELVKYNPEGHDSRIKQTCVNSAENLYTVMLTGLDISGNWKPNSMPFIYLYTVLKQRQLDNIGSVVIDAENTKKQFNDLKQNVETLLSSLQDKAKEVSLHDYSNIFSKQSESHSNWNIKALGGSQIWLIFTLILIGFFGYFIYNINGIYPIEPNANAAIITIEYLTRVLIVSFIIFLISFCAKQFNIQQHLAVVNKHRENTLNSYKLFIDSLGDSNSEVKHALMMEVAKAIYDSGQTGYLGSNDKSDSSPSLIEMTKYVGGNK